MYAVLGNEFVRSITQVFGPFLKTDYYYIVVRGRYFLFRNYWKVISVVSLFIFMGYHRHIMGYGIYIYIYIVYCRIYIYIY